MVKKHELTWLITFSTMRWI